MKTRNQNLSRSFISQLIDGICKNEPGAFQLFLYHYTSYISAVIFKKSFYASNEIQKEIFQEVSMRIFIRLKENMYKENKGNFGTWIGKVTANICIDYYRETRKYKALRLDSPVSSDTGKTFADLLPSPVQYRPDEMLLKKERGKILEQSIKMLRPVQRLLIQKFYFEQKRMEEIQQETGIPMGTIKATLFRARYFLGKNPALKKVAA